MTPACTALLRRAARQPVSLAELQRAVGWGNTLRALEARGLVEAFDGHVMATRAGLEAVQAMR
jgi:hypothetical protein